MTKESSEQVPLTSLIQELKAQLLPYLSLPKCWLNEHEASRYLGISVHSLRAWRSRQGSDGPGFHKIGNRVLYHKDDLDFWVKSHKIKGKKGDH